MEEVKKRLLQEGVALGRGLLKVDSFLNHQIDPQLMSKIGQEFACLFREVHPTKVLTAETSGIAPALMTALDLHVPLVVARKNRPITMPRQPLRESTLSRRDERIIELLVSPEFLVTGDRVLLVDDFLSSPQELLALARLVQRAGAQVVGVGVVIEKTFDHGREALEHLGLRVEALATVDRIEDDRVVLRG